MKDRSDPSVTVNSKLRAEPELERRWRISRQNNSRTMNTRAVIKAIDQSSRSKKVKYGTNQCSIIRSNNKIKSKGIP